MTKGNGFPNPELVCPACDREGLVVAQTDWRCPACALEGPALLGIADLRAFDDPFLDNRTDSSFAAELARASQKLNSIQLLDYFYNNNPVPVSHAQKIGEIAHIDAAPLRARAWLDAIGPIPEQGAILDLGCGPGAFLAAIANPNHMISGCDQSQISDRLALNTRFFWGADVALRWLVVARKRLDELGLGPEKVRLVCCCAEKSPFRSKSFALVVAGDVFEHVADQPATLAESHRTLVPGGKLFLASPNRYSLSLEPHVKVWGVGYLPRKLMPLYVRMLKGVDFRAIRTLGVLEWKRTLAESPFQEGEISAPGPTQGEIARFRGLKRILARLYQIALATPLGRALSLQIGPLFHVVCTKADSSTPIDPEASRPEPTTIEQPATPGAFSQRINQ